MSFNYLIITKEFCFSLTILLDCRALEICFCKSVGLE